MHGEGGVHGEGVCVTGGHVWQGVCMAGETATAVDSTHPAGMHSCPEGGANSQRGCTDMVFFAENCMKNERIWTSRGARIPGAPLDLPMPMVCLA